MKWRTFILFFAILGLIVIGLVKFIPNETSQILSDLSDAISTQKERSQLEIIENSEQTQSPNYQNDEVYNQFKKVKISKNMMSQIESELTSMEPGRLVSLKLFAESLAPQMELAFKDEGFAKEIFDDLKVCAEGVSVKLPIMVRALCAANGQRITNKYPSRFESEMRELKKNLSPQMKNVLEVMSKN